MEAERKTLAYANLRAMWDTRFTPTGPQVLELLELAKAEAGGTWAALADAVGIRRRHMRRLYKGTFKTVSFRTMDLIMCRTDHVYRLLDLEWLTAEELMERGIWKPPFYNTVEQVMQPQWGVSGYRKRLQEK